ncbi:MAG TPA: ferritin family protein [Desulfomonilaceae bacterium]|nr:ferritin family protein [Desulfomonilaceae bacterium]
MDDSCDRCLQMLATALEKEIKGAEFYRDAMAKCSNQVGKELFRCLMADEGIHIKRVKQIYESLHRGQPWSETWKSEAPSEDLNKLTKKRITELGAAVTADTNDMEALKIGIQMEQGAINFYEDQLKKASNPLESEFIKCMIAEERTHFQALEDVILYFTDPESWYIEKERPPIDGA